MGVITQAVMVRADIDVSGMDPTRKVRLADEIFAKQPNLLASILVLPRLGVSLVELEVPLHILLVTFQAMKRSGHVWQVVSEDVQDRCMQRLTARVWRVNLDERRATIWMRTVSRRDDHARHLIVVGRLYATGVLSPGLDPPTFLGVA